MTTTLKPPFGLRDGELVHVTEVPNGLSCDCLCPACRAPLIARNGGTMKVPHFAHHNIDDCGCSIETALHIMAKEIIEKEKRMFFPTAYIGIGNFSARYADAGLYGIEKVELEKRLGTIIPDIICHIDGKPVMIEITVTHGIDEEKKKKIEVSPVSQNTPLPVT